MFSAVRHGRTRARYPADEMRTASPQAFAWSISRGGTRAIPVRGFQSLNIHCDIARLTRVNWSHSRRGAHCIRSCFIRTFRSGPLESAFS